MIRSNMRLISTDLNEEAFKNEKKGPLVSTIVDYPLLFHTKSKSQLVVTNLSDQLQSQILVELGNYKFVTFLTQNREAKERVTSSINFICSREEHEQEETKSGENSS